MTERKQFEAWIAINDHIDAPMDAWAAWQARAALSQQAEPEYVVMPIDGDIEAFAVKFHLALKAKDSGTCLRALRYIERLERRTTTLAPQQQAEPFTADDACDYPPAAQQAEPVAWMYENVDRLGNEYCVVTTQHRLIPLDVTDKGITPLYAAPPAVQQEETVAIPSFIRRPIEQAIDDAMNPPVGSMVVGMPKAYVATDKLAYLLRMFDQGLYAAPPPNQPAQLVETQPGSPHFDGADAWNRYAAPPADDEAVRLLREARDELGTAPEGHPWHELCAAIDAYLAKVNRA